jgi:hypothetical protein
VIGVWLMLAIILLSGGALILGVWRILLGAFDGRALLLLWLALALPLCWAISALTVLTAAFWGNRRRSILFGLLFMPAFAVLVVGSGMQIAYVSALAHPVYISMTTRDTTQSDILLHVGLGWALLAGVTLVAWTGVWALTRFLEAR